MTTTHPNIVLPRITDEQFENCRAKEPTARILFNASRMLGNKLILNGIDYNDGLLAMAAGRNGSEAVRNIAFTGHNHTISRMNKRIHQVAPEMVLHKVGVLDGFSYPNRNVYCPSGVTMDSIQQRPRLLWDAQFERIAGEAYADSARCFAEDWEHQLRQMRGMFLLYVMRQNLKGRDTSGHYRRRLARLFNSDQEAGIFCYMADLEKAGAFAL